MQSTFSDLMLWLARRGAVAFPGAVDGVSAFVAAAQNPDGGFRGRDPGSDLYYTAFGLECLAALREGGEPVSRARTFLRGCRYDALDPIHLACAARAWTRGGRDGVPGDIRRAIIDRLAAYRLPNGAYRVADGDDAPSPYGCFLAYAVYEDCGAARPAGFDLLAACNACRAPDGAYNNEPGMEDGATPATAGVALLQTRLPHGPETALLGWLLERYAGGGFDAFPGCPAPDLLSTAIALLALWAGGVDLDVLADDCARYVQGLQTSSGGWRGHAFDDEPDLEYTFYGLLALGCLARDGGRSTS